jgi:replicative DNA helicase
MTIHHSGAPERQEKSGRFRKDQSGVGQHAPRQAELIIGKQWNGRTGKQKVLFQHEYQRFVEVATPEGIDE